MINFSRFGKNSSPIFRMFSRYGSKIFKFLMLINKWLHIFHNKHNNFAAHIRAWSTWGRYLQLKYEVLYFNNNGLTLYRFRKSSQSLVNKEAHANSFEGNWGNIFQKKLCFWLWIRACRMSSINNPQFIVNSSFSFILSTKNSWELHS